ncbi:GNAT family N-acetyltransferase [Stigmatella sp. ncwal1]|uniref:GNAT family N-acetyltransferase n=1 Tax=Stigmatella ashevillensis TaxID=2995309 RepID=A0ABT5DC40_9BACT|nr:GNAT family N-acetyltransferase [Stigmatella ashevillena]MDC0709907.1 GNAT family N-acetyltransferase [Stigmatella ashevillena]
MVGTHPVDLAAFVESTSLGRRLWLRGAGRSLYPLLRSGDSIQVLRCGPEELSRGDVALVRVGRRLIAHVVVSTGPLVTASLLGHGDPEGVPLGRVTALRRGWWILPLPRVTRPSLFLGQRLASALWARPVARGAARRLRDFTFSGWSRPVRARWLGRLEVRLLRAEDLDALLVFAGERLLVSSVFLRRQLLGRWAREGGAVGASAGAFDSAGRLCGFAYLDSYREEGLALDGLWVRSLVVAPRARRMGVAHQLLTCLVEAARKQGEECIFADVDEDNAASLRTFRRVGFRFSPPELIRRVNAEWDASGGSKPLVVLERALD